MSSTFHAVQRFEILTGFGYFPDFTPAQKPDRLIGKIARILGNLINPVSGKLLFVIIVKSSYV